jgi:hypothetical protein
MIPVAKMETASHSIFTEEPDGKTADNIKQRIAKINAGKKTATKNCLKI